MQRRGPAEGDVRGGRGALTASVSPLRRNALLAGEGPHMDPPPRPRQGKKRALGRGDGCCRRWLLRTGARSGQESGGHVDARCRQDDDNEQPGGNANATIEAVARTLG